MTQDLTETRCNCGYRRRKMQTLEYELHTLIVRHALPEVLDRLAKQVSDQAHFPENADLQAEWSQLGTLLEKANDQALILATLKDDRGKNLWSE